jgi:undecaprenyl-diphosphatase
MSQALKVLFLAVLQGVAEFLPVSSSGHLALAGCLLKFEGMGPRVEAVLHFGTLVALVAYYWRIILAILRRMIAGKREGWIAAGMIVTGCIPAILAYLLFDDAIDAAFGGSPKFIGALLVVTGLILLSLRLRKGDGDGKITWWRTVAIGVAQAVALFPGISRSGSTIVCARHLGVSPKNAADYSFLMSLPLVFGATLMAVVQPGEAVVGEPGWGLLIPAAVVAGAVGYFSIKLLMRVIAGPKFWYFGFYCIAAGLLTLILS